MKGRVGLVIIACAVGVAYALPSLLAGRLEAATLAYVVRPGLWLSCAVLALYLRRRTEGSVIAADGSVIRWGALSGVAQVAVLVLVGLVTSFGRSPYDSAILSVVLNTVYAASLVLATEAVRAYVIGVVGRRMFTVAIVGSAALVTLVSITPASFGAVDGPLDAVSFLGGRVLPSLSENIAASLLVFLGGMWAGIAYRGVIEAFRWYAPILPNPPWVIAGIAGAAVPLAILMLLGYAYKERLPESEDESPEEHRSMLGWVATAGIAAFLIWFATGVLGPTPLLVGSRSMSPKIDLGDVVIVSSVDVEAVATGDVIAFSSPQGTTIHRVVSIEGEGDERTFVTKGDANSNSDADPVMASNLKGRVVTVVPKIGWVGIFFRNTIGAMSGRSDRAGAANQDTQTTPDPALRASQ